MGLFDDILKKPMPAANPPSDPLSGGATTGNQTGGQVSGGAPAIVKTDGGTIFGPESESEMIQAQNKPPAAALVHAEEDSSSVLMPAAGQSSAPIAPVAPIPEQIVVAAAPEVVNTPITMQADTPAPISSQETPMTQSIAEGTQETVSQASSTFISAVVPVQAAPITGTNPVESGNQDALQIPAGPSLFDHIMREEEAAAASVAPAQAVPVAQVVTPPVPVQSITPAPLTTSGYASPREFIEKSLDNIDTMLFTIDTRHTEKMTEAEGYRMEKMRFAELEKNAYAEAEIMDRERDHTLRMKSIFEKELDADEVNRTKRTSAQEVLTEKHPHAHKKHVHEEEEELVAAS